MGLHHPTTCLDSFTDWALARLAPCFGRLYVCLCVLVTCAIAAFSTTSLNRVAFVGLGGDAGWIVLALLASLALLGLLDTAINDLLPERWQMQWAKERRWVLYMGLALGLGAMVYVCLAYGLLTALSMRYGLDCLMALMVAALDVMEQTRRAEAREAT